MTIMDAAILRARGETARIAGERWRVEPRVKAADARPQPDATRPAFTVTARLFMPDRIGARSAVVEAFETGRAPGFVADDPQLAVYAVPAGCVIRQNDILIHVATGRRFRVSDPPGGDDTGHVRLSLTLIDREGVP
jgi:hypothetical protein